MNDLFVKSVRISSPIPCDSYVCSLPVVKHLGESRLTFRSPVTFFVGENGTGKSTLIEAIAIVLGFNPEGGTKNFMFSTSDSHSCLCDHIIVEQGHTRPKDGFFLRAESFYNAASYLDELAREDPAILRYYGHRSLHGQSHGESFLACMENRFRGNGIYILDEPEAALSPNKIMSLICIMHELVKRGSQFLISTHSPMLMTYPEADIFELSDVGITRTTYDKTNHYNIMRTFLDRPEKMLKILLGD